jgi:light-regulated signal transduction histidine kinase (bacteriophytochrome)
MNGLLQNLVTFSRISLTPALKNVRLTAAVQAVLFKLAPAIKQCGAVVNCGALPEIPAHEGQLSHLFEQVLANSLLFRREQPLIEISAEEGDLDGDPAQVVLIKDNGVGIEPQFLLQVLQPFKRLHGKDVPGNGLGLAICEKVMRAHNGKLWLESDGKSGTSVYMAFPV